MAPRRSGRDRQRGAKKGAASVAGRGIMPKRQPASPSASTATASRPPSATAGQLPDAVSVAVRPPVRAESGKLRTVAAAGIAIAD